MKYRILDGVNDSHERYEIDRDGINIVAGVSGLMVYATRARSEGAAPYGMKSSITHGFTSKADLMKFLDEIITESDNG